MAVGVVPRLHVIADRGVFPGDEAYLEAVFEVARALTSVAAALHVRIKPEPRPLLSVEARRLTAGLSAAGRPVLLNGTVEQALAEGFDGAHWPQRLIPRRRVPLPAGFLLGASVHDRAALAAAERAGAGYAMFGPLWSPGSGPKDPVGPAALAELVAYTALPLVAVGGVTPARVAECRRRGAHGVAVVSGILCSADKTAAVTAYAAALAAA